MILDRIADCAILVDVMALAVDFTTDGYNISDGTMGIIHFCVSIILLVEIVVRIVYKGQEFWHNRWDRFDLIVTVVGCLSLLPWIVSVRLIRTLRLIRALRLFTLNAHLRLFAHALATALPRIGWASIFFFLLLVVYTLIGIALFGTRFPEYFGTVRSSMFCLFQVMTLESWASDIARPIMAAFPVASPIYFVSFIIIGSYILLNMLAGVITSSAFEIYAQSSKLNETKKDDDELRNEIASVRDELKQLKELLEAQRRITEGNESAKRKDEDRGEVLR